jgi:uncharacterized protein YjbI with pentapeptide repeats
MSDDEQRIRPPPLKLMRSILDHQRWLNTNGRFGRQLNADELLFENLDLSGVDFSRAYLSDARFSGGSLNSAKFAKAFLAHATFIRCKMDDTDFSGADLRDATFLTDHQKACFDGAVVDRVAWDGKDALDRQAKFPKRIYALPKLTQE